MIAPAAPKSLSHSRPPRIGYLLRMYPRFSQTFVVNEILELERQGLDVHIVSMRKPDEGVFHESVCRVAAQAHYLPETVLGHVGRTFKVHGRRLRSRPGAYWRAMTSVVTQPGVNRADLLQAGHLLAWASKRRIDHLHVHFGTHEATVALLANAIGGLSYSMTLHAFDIFRDNVNRALLARKINRSRFTVTVSEFNRRFLTRRIPGVERQKVRLSYNGIDLERFSTDGQVRDPCSVLAVGRLIEKKGFGHLVSAIEILHKQGLDVRCRIVGDGREQKRLKKQIGQAKLTSLVELTGPLKQQDVRKLMRQSTCLALPCVQAKDGNVDALPTVLLEALASSCPCISTRLSGIPEIIEDEISGLLVEPGDVPALASAIRRVVTSPDLAQRLGRDGCTRAGQRFDIRKNVAVMHEWLCQAGASARQGAATVAGDATSRAPTLTGGLVR